MTTAVSTDHHTEQKPRRNILLRAGFVRAAWMSAFFFGIGVGITVLVRYLEGWYPLWKGDVITTVSLTAAPIGFLAGIGVFDYWVSYASAGRPCPTTTRATVPTAGRTTSRSTPTTR